MRSAAKKEKDEFAAKIKREKEARERVAARKRASDHAFERARVDAAAEASAARAQYLAEERAARARLQKVIDAAEADRNPQMTEEELKAAAKRMRDRWRAAPPPPPRAQRDPYAEWRGTTGRSHRRRTAHGGDQDSDSEGGSDDCGLSEATTEEEVAQAMARKARVKERDAAARRILAHSSKTLMQALGLQATATDAAVESTVRRLLRLLHPDYAINLSIKDTRQHERIEAAFKRLNGLRDETIRL